MTSRIFLCGIGLSAILCADTLVTKNGRTVHGTYLGGDARQIRMTIGDRVETFDVTDVSRLEFGGEAAPAPAAPARRERVELMHPDNDSPRNTRAQQQRAAREIPAGTSLVIRMIDDVDSERDRLGQTFRASVDEAVLVDNQTLIPRGAEVVAKLVEDKQSGKLSGRTVLTLDLVSIDVNGKTVDVLTNEVSQASSSRGARTGKVVGGTAAVGAIIGAIAGGGKGAAIGAASGAAVGAGAEIMTKGQRVRIPSETRLTFNLQQPLYI